MNLLSNIVIFILILDISRSSIMSSQWVEIGLVGLLLVLNIVRKKEINPKLFLIILVFFIVNIAGMIYANNVFSFFTVAKISITLIVLPYLLIKIFGAGLWVKVEKIVYILTIISLPLFLINVIFPQYFNELLPIFRYFTRDVFHKFDHSNPYWSAIVYVNAIADGGLYRNSGFMWEPGAFAMIIIWAMSFNWLTNGMKIDKKFIIYFLALVTTFSTAGYLALFILFNAYYIRKLTFKNIAILIVSSIFFAIYIYQLDFMGKEINSYLQATRDNVLIYNRDYGAIKVNRIHVLIFDFARVIKYPFGYGYGNDSEIVAVNGLSSLLVMWGIPIFVYLIILIRRYFSIYNFYNLNGFSRTMFLLSLLVMFFSNPIDRTIFVYLIFTTAIFIGKNNYEE